MLLLAMSREMALAMLRARLRALRLVMRPTMRSVVLPASGVGGGGLAPRFAHAAASDGDGGLLAFGGCNVQDDLNELCSIQVVVVAASNTE